MFNEECKFQSYIKHNLFILNMFFMKFTEFRPNVNEECKFQSYIKHNLFILNMFFMKFTEFRTNVNEECKFQSYIKHNIYYHALIMKFMGSGFNRQ